MGNARRWVITRPVNGRSNPPAAISTPPAPSPPARMTTEASRLSLLEELDARQNELLDELERLNSRVEQVLRESLTWRSGWDVAVPGKTL